MIEYAGNTIKYFHKFSIFNFQFSIFNSFNRFVFFIFLWIIILSASGLSGLGVNRANAQSLDYDLYQKFLDQSVREGKNISGFQLSVLDYNLINRDKTSSDSLYSRVLAMFRAFNPGVLKTREDKIAFWINAYNIGAIKMIIDHYPIDSIRSRKISWLRNPWGKEIMDIGGRGYSLNEIEHEILLGTLKEPMAHFAIVCASLSCPDLSGKVYRPATVKDQMKSQARAFLSNGKKGLKIERKKGVITFSQIFKFDTHTFPNGAKDAVLLIIPFLNRDDAKYLASGKYKIDYFVYDWSVNDLSRVK